MKLNKKGFTLIELLAIIVILAIILIVSIPTILDSINDARLTSLHSQSKTVATWYVEGVASDDLAFGGENYVDVIGMAARNALEDEEWHCLGNVGSTDLFSAAGLSEADLKKTGAIPTGSTASSANCSAIRVIGGKPEILLVATKGGKFQVGGQTSVTYAFSSDASAVTEIDTNTGE